MVFKHCRALVTPEQVKPWFSITPTGSQQNVVPTPAGLRPNAPRSEASPRLELSGSSRSACIPPLDRPERIVYPENSAPEKTPGTPSFEGRRNGASRA